MRPWSIRRSQLAAWAAPMRGPTWPAPALPAAALPAAALPAAALPAAARPAAAMVAAAMVLIAGCGPTATSAGQLGWRVVATVPGRDNVTELFGVTAAGTSAAWATGISEQRGTSTVVPVLESWSGSAWSRVTLPRAVAAKLGSDPRLGAVAASGPHDVWAFGPRGAWLHGSGSVWTAGMISRSPVDVRSALAFGSDTVWALGGLGGRHLARPGQLGRGARARILEREGMDGG